MVVYGQFDGVAQLLHDVRLASNQICWEATSGSSDVYNR